MFSVMRSRTSRPGFGFYQRPLQNQKKMGYSFFSTRNEFENPDKRLIGRVNKLQLSFRIKHLVKLLNKETQARKIELLPIFDPREIIKNSECSLAKISFGDAESVSMAIFKKVPGVFPIDFIESVVKDLANNSFSPDSLIEHLENKIQGYGDGDTFANNHMFWNFPNLLCALIEDPSMQTYSRALWQITLIRKMDNMGIP